MISDHETRPHPGTPCDLPANGSTVWIAQDPRGFQVYLDLQAEEHVLDRHPEMKNYWGDLRKSIEDPDTIQADEQGRTWFYYRLSGRTFDKHKDVYISTVVDASTGRVKTAMLMKAIRSKGVTLWIRSHRR